MKYGEKSHLIHEIRKSLTDLAGDKANERVGDDLKSLKRDTLSGLRHALLGATISRNGLKTELEATQALMSKDAFTLEGMDEYLKRIQKLARPWEKEYGNWVRKTGMGHVVGKIDPTLGGYLREHQPDKWGFEARSEPRETSSSWHATQGIAVSLEEAQSIIDQFLVEYGFTLLEEAVQA